MAQVERYAAGVRRFDFDAGLAPYDLASYGQWRALSDLLTPAVLERLSPAQARPRPPPAPVSAATARCCTCMQIRIICIGSCRDSGVKKWSLLKILHLHRAQAVIIWREVRFSSDAEVGPAP